MTPPRLVELECPSCSATHWVIDSDYRGMDPAAEDRYDTRVYRCRQCGQQSTNHRVIQKAPAAFLLQPHPLYPMTESEFEYWVGILREHFPEHPKLARLGSDFYPCTPAQAQNDRRAFEAAHPVAFIRDQDGAGRRDPTYEDAEEWLDMMGVGDTLILGDRRGGEVVITRGAPDRFGVLPMPSTGVARTLDRTQVLNIVRDLFHRSFTT